MQEFNFYKNIELQNKDIIVSNKEWLINYSDFDTNNIQLYMAEINSQVIIVNNITKHSLYKVVSNVYYNEYWLSEYYQFINSLQQDNNVDINNLTIQQVINYFLGYDTSRWLSPDILLHIENTLDNNINPLLGEKCVYLSIPIIISGEGIKKNSLIINLSNGYYIFDIDGKLYSNENPSICVGNIFYNNSTIIITEENMVDYIELNNCTSIEFKSTLTQFQYSYLCTIGKHEFNVSYNHTMFESMSINSGSGIRCTGNIKQELLNDSDFSTYLTSIGLYNSNNDLLLVGKLTHPIKNDKNNDISILLQFII